MSDELSDFAEINAVLGAGTRYDGKLTFRGRARIDGEFKGEVFSEGMLIVGAEASITGTVDVGTLIVLGGTLDGPISAGVLVELHTGATVLGDIVTPQIFIDRGVHFSGKCTMPEGKTEIVPMDAEARLASGELDLGEPETEQSDPPQNSPEVALSDA